MITCQVMVSKSDCELYPIAQAENTEDLSWPRANQLAQLRSAMRKS